MADSIIFQENLINIEKCSFHAVFQLNTSEVSGKICTGEIYMSE